MNQHSNPFVRGYRRLRWRRVLLITVEDDCPPVYRPLHDTQANLSDDQVQLQPCVFCGDFALVADEPCVRLDLAIQCQGSGIIHAVLYSIESDDHGTLIHVGDTYSREAACEVVSRLTFDTGHYSRCWEISSGHLPEDAMRYLEKRADIGTPTGLLFEPFPIRDSHGVGVKLISTPWTDRHLRGVDGRGAEELRREHLRAGVPGSLIQVLHLAARADARFIVFDPDAPILTGLQVYE